MSPTQLESVDVGIMNLLCAEGLRGSETIDVKSCVQTLDAWARHVERETRRNFHHFLKRPKEFNSSIPYYRMGMLGTVLAEDLRIKYNPERQRQLQQRSPSLDQWNVFFSSSRDVFIHGLLTGEHHGTCASMPFLYVAIGRRLGYPVTIAARKHHLYVRYEAGAGEHLNIEATENLGFATPTDEEYRNGPFSMTQEEIDGCGWLRPLSNKENLGICLLNRSACLRSMKEHDEESKTLDHAARYLPDTPLMRRVLSRNRELAANLHKANRWDELWAQVEELRMPTGGPMFEHFQNEKLRIQLFMNQSTNLAEIEKSVRDLEDELRRYGNEISDYPEKIAVAFGSAQPSVSQQRFLALLRETPLTRRIVLPQERVPPAYWNGVPPELLDRLHKLGREEEILTEMHVYAAEEMRLRNLETMQTTRSPYVPAIAQRGPEPQVNIRPEDVPLPWRGRPIPPELQERLANMAATTPQSVRQMRTRDEISRYFIDQDQRRMTIEAIQVRRRPLDQQPVMHPPLQIEIVPSEKPLTPPLESPISGTAEGNARP